MAYGLEFKNNSDVVTLDSEFSRLVVLQKGRYTTNGAGFSPAITTQEPPLVFVRPDGSTTFQYCSIAGGAGNWTGFSFVGDGTYGAYFVAAFMSRPLSNYGLRLWDGTSKQIFDSGTPCAQFTRTITSWTYLGSTPTGGGQTQGLWTAPSPLDTGDFMLLNNVGMGVCGSSTRFSQFYCTWDYSNNRIVPFVIGVANSIYLNVPITFAKPVT